VIRYFIECFDHLLRIVVDTHIYALAFVKLAQMDVLLRAIHMDQFSETLDTVLSESKRKVCIHCMRLFKVEQYLDHQCWTKHYLWLKGMVNW
jgi:hypothetical protein